ncbi:nuclear transport factor 2 [Xylariomycetidae sp. FL0641]|nr:nuclear transport factor 2 [Xylariomycetidae sp. FL0641]
MDFDQNRANLAKNYRAGSTMTFESASVSGPEAIGEKLKSLPFEQGIRHQLSTLDAQPGLAPNTIMALVTGQLLVDQEQRPMNFSQAFLIAVDEKGEPYIHNDIFKLIFG